MNQKLKALIDRLKILNSQFQQYAISTRQKKELASIVEGLDELLCDECKGKEKL